jgi:hypothetical protein
LLQHSIEALDRSRNARYPGTFTLNTSINIVVCRRFYSVRVVSSLYERCPDTSYLVHKYATVNSSSLAADMDVPGDATDRPLLWTWLYERLVPTFHYPFGAL